MDSRDVYVQVGSIDRDRHDIPLTLRFFPDRQERLEVSFLFLAVAEPDRSPRYLSIALDSAQELADAIGQKVIEVSREASYLRDVESWRLLLDIGERTLIAVDWEELAFGDLDAEVVRFWPITNAQALIPFTPPLSVLEVCQPGDHSSVASANVFRYYKHRRTEDVEIPDLIGLLHAERHDVVQLHLPRYTGDFRYADGQLEIEWGTAGSIGTEHLAEGLAASGTRLLILQCEDPTSYAQALGTAQTLLQTSGMTTLVVGAPTIKALDNLFMSIVHDQRLAPALARPAARAAMFQLLGGDEVLRISPLEKRVLRDTRRNAALLSQVEDAGLVPDFNISAAGGFEDPYVFFHSETGQKIRDLQHLNQSLAHQVFDYSRESGAWIPLESHDQDSARVAAEIDRLHRTFSRSVNVGLVEDGDPVREGATLRPGASYELRVKIGRRAAWSVIDGDAAFPETAVTNYLQGNAVELRVVIFAPAFEVPAPDNLLLLEPLPRETETLKIPLRAPRKIGPYRLRVCIYRELNLLQSILMRADVADSNTHDAEVSGVAGVRAEVEYSLSTTLDKVESWPRKALNILCNATDEGTHTFAVVGGSMRESFDFGEGEMRAAVDEARRALLAIAADDKTKPPTYRFDNENRTTLKQLAEDTIKLATLGYQLYWNIVSRKDHGFESILRETLGTSRTPIQIAATKSAQYVFPWALVYDHALVEGNAKFCPQFTADFNANQPLSAQTCLANGCKYRGQLDVVCPSGFWGFKHLIEQPLSVGDGSAAGGVAELPREIKADPAGDIGALMMVSRDLKQVAAHERELLSGNSFRFRVEDTKYEMGKLMGAHPLDSKVLYFYCHGGRANARTWLGIGQGERLLASDLGAWEINWSESHPLVFINGCHTADVTPDDLLSFNKAFAWCRAAGVIGTEINIPENLGRAFACGFMPLFAAGAPVGEALRQQRLSLLQRGNLLGLAYTPYCSSQLKIVRH